MSSPLLHRKIPVAPEHLVSTWVQSALSVLLPRRRATLAGQSRELTALGRLCLRRPRTWLPRRAKERLSAVRVRRSAKPPRESAPTRPSDADESLFSSEYALVQVSEPVNKFPAARRLATAIKGNQTWEDLLAPVAATLATKEGKKQLALDKGLQKLLRPVLGDPPKGKASAKILAGLRTFAKKHADTAVGDRAVRLDRVVHSLLCANLRMRWEDVEKKAMGGGK